MGGQESETVFETRCVGGHIIDNANGGLQLRADTLAGTPIPAIKTKETIC